MFCIELAFDQADAEAPDCPHCEGMTRQEFQPVAIAGKAAGYRAAATKMAETIAHEDYGVADMTIRKGEHAKVRYKEPPGSSNLGSSSWVGPNFDMLQAGLREGRAVREQFGSGLEVLQGNLASGKQPDLIEVSKRRSMKVW